jgi:SPP1 family predicted phage head-tail adaptor
MQALRAGQLRRQITLQHNVVGSGTTGQDTFTPTTYATVWARIEDLQAVQSIEDGKQVAVATHLITIRYRSDVDPTDLILWDTRTFNLVGFIEDERHRWIQITAKELHA